MKVGQVGNSIQNVSGSKHDIQPVVEPELVEGSIGTVEPSVETDKKIDDVEMDEDVLENSIKQANKTLDGFNRYIERSVHDVTKTVMYTVKDTKTNEVIAEFPPRKIQDMIAKMWELAGLVVDEKA